MVDRVETHLPQSSLIFIAFFGVLNLPHGHHFQAANLLYQGPWVAERLSSVADWASDPEAEDLGHHDDRRTEDGGNGPRSDVCH